MGFQIFCDPGEEILVPEPLHELSRFRAAIYRGTQTDSDEIGKCFLTSR